MAAAAGIAPASPPLQGGANLSQLNSQKLVPPRGNAPRSIGYQPTALLLSYEGNENDGKERTPLPRFVSVAPAGFLWADLSVFTGTPPTKPLEWKPDWEFVRSEQD